MPSYRQPIGDLGFGGLSEAIQNFALSKRGGPMAIEEQRYQDELAAEERRRNALNQALSQAIGLNEYQQGISQQEWQRRMAEEAQKKEETRWEEERPMRELENLFKYVQMRKMAGGKGYKWPGPFPPPPGFTTQQGGTGQPIQPTGRRGGKGRPTGNAGVVRNDPILDDIIKQFGGNTDAAIRQLAEDANNPKNSPQNRRDATNYLKKLQGGYGKKTQPTTTTAKITPPAETPEEHMRQVYATRRKWFPGLFGPGGYYYDPAKYGP